jgi:hypothetical protein
MATACATTTRDMARQEARVTLANAAALSGTNAAEVVGKSSMAWGDRYTATNLFERAADQRASVGKRFNLAAGYQSTGRLVEAAALYRGLLDDGAYTDMLADRAPAGARAQAVRFNVAEESARRLAVITTQNPYLFPQAGDGALAAGAFATPVAAIEGAPASGRISDEAAIRLDGIAAGG